MTERGDGRCAGKPAAFESAAHGKIGALLVAAVATSDDVRKIRIRANRKTSRSTAWQAALMHRRYANSSTVAQSTTSGSQKGIEIKRRIPFVLSPRLPKKWTFIGNMRLGRKIN